MAQDKILIIYDWDDTIFFTHFLLEQGIRLDELINIKKYIVYFNELDIVVSKLLNVSISIGKVLIITNATTEWVLTSKKFLPRTSKIIDNHVKIISARDIYNRIYDMSEWKSRVFKNNIINYIQWANQIISVGDSMYEYEALISLSPFISHNKYLKTIQFVQSPSVDTLLDQLNVLSKSLSEISQKHNHMDLRILQSNDMMFD